MNVLRNALCAVVDALDSQRVRFALIGGLAVSVRTEPSFTRAVDLAVAVETDAQAERIARRLFQDGWRVLAQLEQDAVGRLASIRMKTAGEAESSIAVDLLFASSGLEPEIVAAAEPLEVFDDVVVPVATAAHLLATKVLAMDDGARVRDRDDAQRIARTLDPAELEETRGALRSIEERGFHRGKDLQAELDQLLH